MAERLESHRRPRPASALLLTVLLSFLVQGCSSDEAGAKPAADTTQDGSGDTASADTSTDSSTTDSTTTDSSDGSAADTVEQDGSGSGDTSPEDPGTCLLGSGDTDPDSAPGIGCFADYEAVSAAPLVESIPGARSAKTVIDRVDGNHLYIQNSRRYPIHWEFASTHLSGNGLPLVPQLGQFNQTEYYTPDRRFLLGALNYYEGPGIWAYEIAPYDTASAEMIAEAFRVIRDHHWQGSKLRFHPTSDTVAREALRLPADVPIVDSDELFQGITYQPLNLARSLGKLRFMTADQLLTEYVSFRDIVVLEAIPNDIEVCSGIITDDFQTPLSHINVLAQNRGTPNMGLAGAFTNETIRALDGKWVELDVGATDYRLVEVTQAEADAWWESNRPPAVGVPRADRSVTDLRDLEEVLDMSLGLEAAIDAAIPAFGGKASHFGGLTEITSMPIPYPKGFVIPIYYFFQFMEQNGFDLRLDAMLADPAFTGDPATRELALINLQNDMLAAPVDNAFTALLVEKLSTDFPDKRMKFRSSTNAEDLDGFTGAGLYTSASGALGDASRPVLDAVRTVWASVFRFRAFEERSYRSISHREVGMAVLVNYSYPNEDANGVAITSNIFDPTGVEPGLYINVQRGETSVVLPPEGVTSDQFVYLSDLPGQPIVYIAHSSLVRPGTSVLTRTQVEQLGQALTAIHNFFAPVYGPNTPDHFYGMDVEFKFNTDPLDPTRTSTLVIKQARPYPGRGN